MCIALAGGGRRPFEFGEFGVFLFFGIGRMDMGWEQRGRKSM